MAAVSLIGAGVVVAQRAAAGFRDHQTIVPSSPARGYPLVLSTPLIPLANGTNAKRQVNNADQIGRVIVVGGDFQQLQMPDGATVAKKWFAAWNLDTKALVCPTLAFDNEVLGFAEGPTTNLMYVVGRFTKVTGADGVVRARSRVALIDLATCSVNAAFVPATIDAKVDEVAYADGRLFIGGDFTKVGVTPLDIVAELDASTAQLRPALDLTFVGTATTKIRALEISPSGNRLIIGGRFGSVAANGLTLSTETAIVNITDPVAPLLTPHRWRSPYSVSYQQDISVSPDGASIGLVYRGTPAPGNNVYLIPSTETAVTETWVHAVGKDSVFGVGLSNNAVYISGHFCRIAQGPAPTDVMSPAMGITDCDQHPDGAWRGHIAALAIADGTPLAWNPGADSLTGGRELTVTTRGLLAGFDGERTNNIRIGALAFYDLGPGAEDTIAPGVVTISAPLADSTVGNPVRISGAATDNVGIAAYLVAVRDAAGLWVQPNGAVSNTRHEFRASPNANGAFDLDVVLPGAGSYTAEAAAIDLGGQLSPAWALRSFTANNTDAVSPSTTITLTPTPPVPSEQTVTVSGAATDNVAVAGVVVRVRTAAGWYVQDDFALASAVNDLPTTVTGAPGADVTWQAVAGDRLPAGTYAAEVVVTDTSNNARTETASFVVVAGTTQTPGLTAYTNSTPKFGNYSMGMTFSVAAATPLSAIGIFDANGNGVLDNAADTPAALWRRSDQALLARVTVARNAPAEGGWFYGTLATPYVLEPGIVYVVAALHTTAGEPYGSGGTVTAAPGVTYLGRAYLSGLALTYPTSQSTSVGYGTPNIRIGAGASAPQATITEPAAVVVFGTPATIAGTVNDNATVGTIAVQVTNGAGEYLQANGTFAAAPSNRTVSTTGLGTPSATFTASAGVLPAGSYTVTVVAADAVANTTTVRRPFVVAPPPPPGGGTAVTAYGGFSPKTGNYTIGATFQVDAAMTATSLGILDVNGNGTLDNATDTPIGLWRQNDRALLSQTTVARTAPLEGGWFYGPLPVAVALQPGVTYVVASLVATAGEPYASGGTLAMAANVRHTGRAYLTGTTFGYPASQSTGTGYGIPNIRFAGGNAAPLIAPIPPQAATVSVAVNPLTVMAFDPEGAALALAATGLPDGLSIDPVTATIVGTPTTAGTGNATVVATDPGGLSDSAVFAWTVAPAPQPPTVAPVAPSTVASGTPITPLALSGSDPEGGALIWSAVGLPLGLVIDPAVGAISGIPVVTGTATATVTATDSQGLSTATTIAWTVVYDAPACHVELVAGKPALTWTAIPGQTTYAVRRNGVFLANVAAPAATYPDAGAPSGSNTYVVRSRLNGLIVDVVCLPVPIAVP